MMKAVFTALALGAGVFLVSPQTASAAPLGLQGATTPTDTAVEKVHGRRHGHHYRHYDRHRHWYHGHNHYRPYRHHYYGRQHYQAGPYFGFSIGPSWGYGHHHHRRWH